MDGNEYLGYFVVFKDRDTAVRIAPSREAFANESCMRESCQGCPGRRCDVRYSAPIKQVTGEEGGCLIRRFLTSEELASPISIRRRAIGEVCEPGRLLGPDEKKAINEFMDPLNLIEYPRQLRVATLMKLQSMAAFLCSQNR